MNTEKMYTVTIRHVVNIRDFCLLESSNSSVYLCSTLKNVEKVIYEWIQDEIIDSGHLDCFQLRDVDHTNCTDKQTKYGDPICSYAFNTYDLLDLDDRIKFINNTFYDDNGRGEYVDIMYTTVDQENVTQKGSFRLL